MHNVCDAHHPRNQSTASLKIKTSSPLGRAGISTGTAHS
jgi:hypothetical protein